MKYKFNPGDRVTVDGKHGEVTTCVPGGNGSIPWYFVRFDDGTEDRFTAEQLTPEW